MPAETRGSVYATRTGYGIRWPENGRRCHQSGFDTKTAARRWFAKNVAPRLTRGAPSPEITFDAFCEVFLSRHGATVAETTKRTLEARLKPARKEFGTWTLRELEGAAGDVAAWRASLDEGSRYQWTSALRQTLGAAVRWQYLGRNPAVDACRNPQPRTDELEPFTRKQVDVIASELGAIFGSLVVFAAETGLRTNEWAALERRDLDRDRRAITVQRRYANGILTPYPKTERPRRRVPLTERALGSGRKPVAPARHPAPVSRGRGRPARSAQLAEPRLVSGARSRRDFEARPVSPTAHLRDRGTGCRSLDLRVVTADGNVRSDGGRALRAPGPRLRGGNSGPPKCEVRLFWRSDGVRRRSRLSDEHLAAACRAGLRRSGRRGSNPRPLAWEANALPAELRPHERVNDTTRPARQ
jgi:integrase